MFPDSKKITSTPHVNKRLCKNFVLTFFNCGSVVSRDVNRKKLKKSFVLLKLSMKLLGILPVTINKISQNYEFHWQTLSTFHSIITLTWLTVLVSCSCIGILRFIPVSQSNSAVNLEVGDNASASLRSPPSSVSMELYNLGYNSTGAKRPIFKAEEFMGILVLLGSVYNAWVQSLTIFYRRRSLAVFLNKWVYNILTTDIDRLSGIFKIGSVSCLLLFVLATFLLTSCIMGQPALLLSIVEAFSRNILMVPWRWSQISLLRRKVIRILTSFALIHAFMIHKVTILAFATNCKLLSNCFSCWRRQLEVTLEEFWKPECERISPPKTLQQLTESHRQIVSMLREVETIFSPVLQFYYASSIVTLCTMLYFVAFQLRPSTYSLKVEEYIWQGMTILQFFLVFLIVSLSASNVHDESDCCLDSLRRGLPFSASERDLFYYQEMVRCVTLSPLAISANRFFVITKPFILTVGRILSHCDFDKWHLARTQYTPYSIVQTQDKRCTHTDEVGEGSVYERSLNQIIGVAISYFIIILQLHHS